MKMSKNIMLDGLGLLTLANRKNGVKLQNPVHY